MKKGVQEQTGHTLLSTVRDGIVTETLTDLGNAKRLLLYHGRDILYHYKRSNWIIWNGKRWVEDESEKRILAKAEDTVKRIYQEASRAVDSKAREAISKHACKSESKARIDAMLSLAKRMCPVEPDELDADPFKFNVENGTIDLRTGELMPHKREDKITMIAPVEYHPDADCPVFKAFLDRIMNGDEALIAFLQRFFGYCLTGDVSEQSILIAYGLGANGKTTLTNVIREVMGPYAITAEFSTFLQERNGNGVRDDLASLCGARFVSAIEAREGKALDEAVIKQLTGGDPITARHLYGRYFTFVPTFKIWLGTNHKPRISDNTHSMWRRVKLVPFIVTIPEEEQDKELPRKMSEEKTGILSWMVKGCLDWQRHGLMAPEIVTTATNEYRVEQDFITNFLEDRCNRNEKGKVRAGKLYEEYKDWSVENGLRTLSQFRFSRKLEEKGLKKGKEGANLTFYYGISLKEDKEEWSQI